MQFWTGEQEAARLSSSIYHLFFCDRTGRMIHDSNRNVIFEFSSSKLDEDSFIRGRHQEGGKRDHQPNERNDKKSSLFSHFLRSTEKTFHRKECKQY
jgi:hypothetical protein